MMLLELAARYTKDGRYRFAAHRLFNYLDYQKDVQCGGLFSQRSLRPIGRGPAYFLADDSIQPVQPDAGSTVLYHKEVLRVKDKEAARAYLKDLDPDPRKAHICCNLLCTDKVMPFKLCLRSGWNPGDLYMLVDLFPRDNPMNPGGVLGMSYQNAALTHGGAGTKDLTDWLNMFRVEDLSGTGTAITNPNPDTVDAYYMDVTVPAFSDHKAATYAKVHVKDYQGFPMALDREFFFVRIVSAWCATQPSSASVSGHD